MKIARYLILAAFVGSLLLHVGRIRAQETRPVTNELGSQRYTQEPAATNLLYPVPAYGGRDHRDVEADRQVQSLLKQLGEAKDEAAKTELQKKLTDVLSKQFDVRQESRERELKELEERVKRLRDVLDKRQKAKDAIVRSHLDQLLRDAEGLGWGDASPDGIKHFPADAGGFGMLLAPNLRGQAPATSTAPVVLAGPDAVPHAYTVIAGPGGRDQRDIEAGQQVASLLKKLKDEKDETAKTELQKRLTEAIAKQFDVRQELRERELKDLEDRVKRLRDMLEKRQKSKETIVRNRLDQLLREAAGLGWGDSTHEVQGHEVQGYAVPRFSTPSNVPAR